MYKPIINVVPFSKEWQDKLSDKFSCGNAFIDDFIKTADALNDGLGKTFVWLSDTEEEIIGFYNITTGGLNYKSDERTYKMGGSIHINEFAIHSAYQRVPIKNGAYVSDILLTECLNRITSLREQIGFAFVTLQSTTNQLLE